MRGNLFILIAMGTASASCVVADDTTSEIEQDLARRVCTGGIECYGNSPIIDTMGFSRLHEHGGRFNGFYIKSFRKAGVSYQLDVTNATLRGIHLAGGPTLQGPALTGAVITVKNDLTGSSYLIEIQGVGYAQYWASVGGELQFAETYLMAWKKQGGQGGYKNLCNNPPINYPDETRGMNAFHVLLFEGEVIDEPQNSLVQTTDDWFSIGCAGNAIAKLLLTGHAKAATTYGFATTQSERQAMLRLVTSDVCGTGVRFTVAGEGLGWIDHRGWMSYPPTMTPALEARWGPNGATCLQDHRLHVPTDPARATYAFPWGIDAAIAEVCSRPRCSDLGESTSPYDLAGKHLVSANPL